MKRLIIVLIAVILILLAAVLAVIKMKNRSVADFEQARLELEALKTEAQINSGKAFENGGARGTMRAVPENIREEMIGISVPSKDAADFDTLSYLTIPYYNFEGKTAVGHMVVNRTVADEVLDIFEEIYIIQYPIENMELPEAYWDMTNNVLPTVENAARGNNNTFSFFMADGTSESHCNGMAIDLNPKVNPWIGEDGEVSPANAKKFADREAQGGWSDAEKAACLTQDSEVCRIFKEHGWKWGGDWSGDKDYRHFYK